ncbi:MAG: ATP-binding protein [Cyanobacteria bacterium J06638_6]
MLIEDLLDTSRIVQDRFQIAPQATDLTALVEQAVTLAQPQITDQELQLEVNLEPCSDLLAVDPARMTQAISNLLLNAIKFTPTGGRITVQLTYMPSQVRIQVSDTGRGITPEVLPSIFDRFRQADASITRREGGLGLGLFLVRSIVEAHGGSVQAVSPGVGQGATFTLVLPKVVAASDQTESSPPSTPPEVSIAGIRILIVEDTEDNRVMYAFALEELDAIVLTASSAPEALNILAAQAVDVLVSDIGLPDIDGYELMRRVRALPAAQGGQIPAIAVTGYVSQEDVQAAMAAGFQRHLAKPISFGNLVEVIFSLVRT